MARLHEYQGKAILAANGFKIPRGRAASTADEAVAVAKELVTDTKGGTVVIKIQAWTTGRAGIGGVAFAKKPVDVRGHAARMLAMTVGQFPVEAVLVEEKIDIERGVFLSFAIDDAARAPVIIFAGAAAVESKKHCLDPAHRLRCETGTARFGGWRSRRFVRTFAGTRGATSRVDPKIICRRAQRRSPFA